MTFGCSGGCGGLVVRRTFAAAADERKWIRTVCQAELGLLIQPAFQRPAALRRHLLVSRCTRTRTDTCSHESQEQQKDKTLVTDSNSRSVSSSSSVAQPGGHWIILRQADSETEAEKLRVGVCVCFPCLHIAAVIPWILPSLHILHSLTQTGFCPQVTTRPRAGPY